MDIPSEVINAVKPKVKARKPYVKKLTKRILHSVGNGLRTATSIANALGVEKTKIQSNLWHLKEKGYVHATKQEGKTELKYYLTTDKPKLSMLDLTKPKRKYTKRVAKVVKVANVVSVDKETLTKLNDATQKLNSITNQLANLELALAEKDKEIWTLECEVFDKKAVIKYLEEKLFALGVRV